MKPPKEYAIELVDKFKEFADEDYHDCKDQWELNDTRKYNAKQIATIDINNTIIELAQFDNTDGYAGSSIEYYQEVLKEIQNIN